MCLSGKIKEAEDELKRLLRAEEKKPRVVGKCIFSSRRTQKNFIIRISLDIIRMTFRMSLDVIRNGKDILRVKTVFLKLVMKLQKEVLILFGDNKTETRIVTYLNCILIEKLKNWRMKL